jgi:putative FmdB family regulatory protein
LPTYEYKCSGCGHRYETREGFDSPSTQACPQCGAVAKRVLFPPPIVFKGSGFYVTDSRKGDRVTIADNASLQTNGSSEEKASSPAPAPAKEESKPAASTTPSADD